LSRKLEVRGKKGETGAGRGGALGRAFAGRGCFRQNQKPPLSEALFSAARPFCNSWRVPADKGANLPFSAFKGNFGGPLCSRRGGSVGLTYNKREWGWGGTRGFELSRNFKKGPGDSRGGPVFYSWPFVKLKKIRPQKAKTQGRETVRGQTFRRYNNLKSGQPETPGGRNEERPPKCRLRRKNGGHPPQRSSNKFLRGKSSGIGSQNCRQNTKETVRGGGRNENRALEKLRGP